MLNDEMDMIEKCVANGTFNRKLLQDLIQKATAPFKHEHQDGYVTITKGNDDATCASVLAMCALDGIISAKRKADELSRIEANRKQNSNKKIKRTPNTTRGDDGVSTAFRLEQFDSEKEKTDSKKMVKNLKQQIEAAEKELTAWGKLVEKKTAKAATMKVHVTDQQLWQITAPKMHTQKERQLFLRLCVPSSGALGKKEEDQLSVLQANDVTYLKLLAAVESAQKRLTQLQKDLCDNLSSRLSVEQQSLDVPGNGCENYYAEEDDIDEAPELL